MPEYRVEALEKFLVRTTYHIEADSPQEAEELCREGEVSYDEKEILGGDEEWVETIKVEEV